MVRTVRSIEEEARVRRVAGVGWDRYLSRPGFLETLDGRYIEALREWSRDGVRRVLVVGLEDGGGLAISLASAGQFVTVVDPDEALVNEVRRKAEAEKCALRMNVYASEYMQKEFASSGFDLAVFLSSLSRYNEPLTVVKKAARELRAGGRFFARIRVRPGLPRVGEWLDRLVPSASKWKKRAMDTATRVALVERWASMPDAEGFLAGLMEVFKVERVERTHIVTPMLAAIGSQLPGETARGLAIHLLQTLVEVERHVARIAPGRFLASYLVVFAVKELGLGRTFRI